jgi:hypothetical protein
MNRVFISYGNRDRRMAEKLCSYLEDRDIPCWIAPRDISTGNYAGEITRALRAADITIVICSKSSCQSEHVKNEVTLAFNNAKEIIPYCLEENPFDDDLEYYLASKQRVPATGDSGHDFVLIEKMIREFRHLAPPAIETTPVRRSFRWLPLAAVLFAVLILGCFLYLKRPEHSTISDIPTADTLAIADSITPQSIMPSSPKSATPVQKKRPESDTFSGRIINGRPDGFGTYTFRKARRIDMHDPEERMALAGDSIQGVWQDGHLNYGEWYDADGRLKAFIQLGDQPDTESDYVFEKCIQP